MKKNILFAISFFVFIVIIIYFFKRDTSKPLQEFFVNIENKLPEIEKINFKYYRDIRSGYSFAKDTIDVDLNYNIFNRAKIFDKHNKYLNSDQLPSSFFKDFEEVKKICTELNVFEVIKDSLNKEITFRFEFNHINTETIPNWDKKNEDNKDRYKASIIYDVSNEKEKESKYYKIKDKWYFYYGESRT
jgi:hypothetical protein